MIDFHSHSGCKKTGIHNIHMVAVSKGLCYLNSTILGYEPIMSFGEEDINDSLCPHDSTNG
ncbi:hypothetical protein GCM10011332_15410 [Terasakiella brassicae]|uniref:Uncharacterized protein n=1 Tax=Terasakiella brassicae TaxID=1634917 RepID=A0A917F9G2_9PROT|nr:hypothetical protein GCM10011332_15410 [Terasakiella brassicae]